MCLNYSFAQWKNTYIAIRVQTINCICARHPIVDQGRNYLAISCVKCFLFPEVIWGMSSKYKTVEENLKDWSLKIVCP